MGVGLNEIKDFLSDFDSFRAYCDTVDYAGMVNPVDGVFYPGVSLDIPPEVRNEVVARIQKFEGRPVAVNAVFLRLSILGMKAPHQAHTDATMGRRSLMLYLNREEDCRGGTSFVAHLTGMDRNPVSLEEEEAWRQDTNNPEAWIITEMCGMQPNKACIFDASLMHRAEPVGGFGEDAKNGRLVLTVFYD